MSVLLKCPTCEKKFYANESAVKKGRKYCGRKCVPWSKIHKGRPCVSIIMEMSYRLKKVVEINNEVQCKTSVIPIEKGGIQICKK